MFIKAFGPKLSVFGKIFFFNQDYWLFVSQKISMLYSEIFPGSSASSSLADPWEMGIHYKDEERFSKTPVCSELRT